MLRGFRRRRRRNARSEPKPGRDAHDHAILIIEALGVLGLIATIFITLRSNSENGREMANAINKMAAIADTLQDQQGAINNQSDATVDLARTGALQAEAANRTANSAHEATKIAQQQTAAYYKQMAQNLEFFAKQQRPMYDYDPTNVNASTPIAHDNLIRWSYGFKNFGAGPAFDVIYYEAISVNGGPFQETRRIGSKMDVPNTKHWSTATYVLRHNELKLPPAAYFYVHETGAHPILRVRFEYSDALGRRYHSTSCQLLDENAIVYDCSYRPNERRYPSPHLPSSAPQ